MVLRKIKPTKEIGSSTGRVREKNVWKYEVQES